jgi:hypothetical protein
VFYQNYGPARRFDETAKRYRSTTLGSWPIFPVFPCIQATLTMRLASFEPGPPITHFHKTLVEPW